MGNQLRHCLICGYGQKADGSLSDQTRDRCNRALDLYLQRIVYRIIITVSAEKSGKRMADAMRDYLISRAVRPEDIKIDPRGGNTAGEIDVFLEVIKKEVHVGIMVVSTWYHIPRIWWLCFVRGHRTKCGIAWKYASWADLRIEPLKIANSILRPFRSAKIVE